MKKEEFKLKTLKNLGLPVGRFEEKWNKTEIDIRNEYIVLISELKAEAIKWVKACELGHSLEKMKHKIKDCKGCHRFVVFFNITEEDLK